MKSISFVATLVVAVPLFLSGCGGGGGGGGDAPAAAVNPVVTVTCPNGASAATASACPVVGTIAPVTLSSVTPRQFVQGLTIQFNGAIDPSSLTSKNIVLQQGTGPVLTTTASLAAGNRDLTIVATQILANGQSFSLQLTLYDSLGRPVQLSAQFTTAAMVCSDNAIWSNPATFAAVLQDCVAGVGVQAKITPAFNKLQDNSCTLTVGVPLSAACHAYLANGTFLLAATSMLVNNNHTALWAVFNGLDDKGQVVALDINDNANPIVVAVLALPSAITSITGNPGGAFIRTAAGRGSEFSVDASSAMKEVCMIGCS